MAVLEINGEKFKEIISTSENAVIQMSASWCMTCAKMLPLFEEVSNNADYKNITFAYIELDDEDDIVEKYFIRGVPVFLFFKNGEVIDRIIGDSSSKELHDFINKNIK